MTGLERNAEIVNLCSYAPLFANVDAWQWTPDLIWFDNLNSYGTPNYYVQKLYATNRGTQVLPMLLANQPLTGQNGLYASAVFDNRTNEIILKMVNATDLVKNQPVTLNVKKRLDSKASLIVLKSDSPDAVNSLEQPKLITPIEQLLAMKGKSLNAILPPNSFSVYKIKVLK